MLPWLLFGVCTRKFDRGCSVFVRDLIVVLDVALVALWYSLLGMDIYAGYYIVNCEV